MKRTIVIPLGFVLASLTAPTARGDWREWFGQPRPEAVAQSPDEEDSIPDQPGAIQRRERPSESNPNMLERFNSGTRKFFSRTRQALTPKKKAAKPTAPKDRPFRGWMPNSMSKPPSKAKAGSGFSTWFQAPEPESGPSSTLEDFFSKPRP